MKDDASHEVEECADVPDSEPDSVDLLPSVDRESLAERLPDYRGNLEQFRRAYGQLKENYSDFFERIRDSNPRFDRLLTRLDDVVAFLERMDDFSDSELLHYVDEYNRLAGIFNTYFSRLDREQQEHAEDSLVAMLEGENLNADFFESLLDEQKAELVEFGRELYAEIFPDSYTDVAVKFYTSRDELRD